MPYYQFGSLQEYRPSDKDYAHKSAFLQILLALSWLHSRGLVHRDIKPENFLLEDEEPLRIVVADFGLSMVTIDHLLTTFCGTLRYCAPEVFPGNSHGYGPKADMWSLGVMMLQLMFGLPDTPNLPSNYSNAYLQDWVKKWSMRLHKKLATCPENNDLMMEILLNMIRVDPKERFTADQCLQRGLDSGLFRRNRDGQIVLQDETEVNAPAEVSWQAEYPEDRVKTPTPQSNQLAEATATDDPFDASFLSAELCGGSFWDQRFGGDKAASANAFSSTGGSNFAPPKQRRKINNTSSLFCYASGLDIDGGRNTRMTASLENQLAPSHGSEECASVPLMNSHRPSPPVE